MINNLLIGDCRNILPSLPDKLVQCVKTFRNGGVYTKKNRAILILKKELDRKNETTGYF